MPSWIRPHTRTSLRLALSRADWSLTGGYTSTQSGITGTLMVPYIEGSSNYKKTSTFIPSLSEGDFPPIKLKINY
ncbi:hypothetical protein [Candidatus Borrarchaeum sp.]|uniref:hypothetical protein n=1 Tax=Candidatus Borrarchaeum sp. TaxID=2846742 RepID=UPI00257E9CF9|nr:hypothetical protein [Candidatus Borrarchaeum sp.]